jgi:hypothetical protein
MDARSKVTANGEKSQWKFRTEVEKVYGDIRAPFMQLTNLTNRPDWRTIVNG